MDILSSTVLLFSVFFLWRLVSSLCLCSIFLFFPFLVGVCSWRFNSCRLQSVALAGLRGVFSSPLSPYSWSWRCLHCAAGIPIQLAASTFQLLALRALVVDSFSRRACFVNAILGTGARLLRHDRVSGSAAGLVGGSLTFPFQAASVRLQLAAPSSYIRWCMSQLLWVPGASLGVDGGPWVAVHELQHRRRGGSTGFCCPSVDGQSSAVSVHHFRRRSQRRRQGCFSAELYCQAFWWTATVVHSRRRRLSGAAIPTIRRLNRCHRRLRAVRLLDQLIDASVQLADRLRLVPVLRCVWNLFWSPIIMGYCRFNCN